MQDYLGRKPTILVADVLFTLGAAIMATASSIPILMLGRFVVGLGVGAASLTVPVYLSEVCPIEVRGTVVAVNVMMITAGQFISSILCWALGSNWRLMLGLAGVPSFIQLVGMIFMPESQRWLAKSDK